MSKCEMCRFSKHINNNISCYTYSPNGKCNEPAYQIWQPRACGFCKHLYIRNPHQYEKESLKEGQKIFECQKYKKMMILSITNIKEVLSECEHFQNRVDPIEPKQEKSCTRCNVRGSKCGSCTSYSEWEAKGGLEDFEYLNINGIEYINKFEERDKKQKEVSKMEDVSVEIEQTKKELKEVKKKSEELKDKRYNIWKKVDKELNWRHWHRICAKQLKKKVRKFINKKAKLKRRERKALKKLRFDGYFKFSKHWRTISLHKASAIEWKLFEISLTALRNYLCFYDLDKIKRELCYQTDCYKALSDTEGKCSKCGKDIPKGEGIRFCQFCGKEVTK